VYNINGTGTGLTTLLLEPPGQKDLDFLIYFNVCFSRIYRLLLIVQVHLKLNLVLLRFGRQKTYAFF